MRAVFPGFIAGYGFKGISKTAALMMLVVMMITRFLSIIGHGLDSFMDWIAIGLDNVTVSA